MYLRVGEHTNKYTDPTDICALATDIPVQTTLARSTGGRPGAIRVHISGEQKRVYLFFSFGSFPASSPTSQYIFFLENATHAERQKGTVQATEDEARGSAWGVADGVCGVMIRESRAVCERS